MLSKNERIEVCINEIYFERYEEGGIIPIGT
jgi:hypothetical protein